MKPDRIRSISRARGVLYAILPFLLLLRLYVYWQEIDPATGFFNEEKLFCLCYNAVGFAVLILSLFLAFFVGRKPREEKEAGEKREESEEKFNPSTVFDEPEEEGDAVLEGELCEAGKRGALWRGALSAFSSFLPAFSLLCYAALFLTLPEASRNDKIWAIFSVICGFLLFFFALTNSPRVNRLRAFSMLLPAVWCTWRLVTEYQDLDRFTNKTLYVGQFLFLISAAIFFCYYGQLLLGEKALFSPEKFAFTAMPVIFFGATARLAQLIAAVGGKAELDFVDGAALLVDLSLTVFAMSKLSCFLQKK